MAVPLESKRGQAKFHRSPNSVLRRLIGGEQADGVDLATAMALVLGGVELVGGRGARREAVMTGEFAVDLFGNLAGAAELAFDKGEHGDAFEG